MPPPSVADLQDPARFRPLEKVEFDRVLGFVVEYYLRRRNWVVLVNYALTLANLAWVLGLGIAGKFAGWLGQLALASLAMLALIPLHELLHALAYRLLGARDIRFGILLRQGAAYAVAHHFVVGQRAFTLVALAPFLVINGGCLLLALADPRARLFAALLSFLHLTAVGGDWAMLSFLWVHRGRPIYTYDDVEKRVSYFYQEK